MSTFKGLKGGDRIAFYIGAGPHRTRKVARVQPLLTFPTHVVVNLGGKYGRPAVVTESNFIGRA